MRVNVRLKPSATRTSETPNTVVICFYETEHCEGNSKHGVRNVSTRRSGLSCAGFLLLCVLHDRTANGTRADNCTDVTSKRCLRNLKTALPGIYDMSGV